MENQPSRSVILTFLTGTLALGTACHPGNRESRNAPQKPFAEARPGLRITRNGIGPVALGMTLGQARMALPTGQFVRSSDGEGVALVDVKVGGQDVFTVFADEDDPDSAIDWSRKIVSIETFSDACSTSEGVHPGMLIKEVEKVYGKVTQLFCSDIEQREFVDFSNGPKHYVFRSNNMGLYGEGMKETTRYRPDAKIHSIAVLSSPP